MVINSGLVQVNGVIETQKRKKIVDGDLIEFAGQIFQVQFKAD
jgi:ribosome-associated protein